MNRTASALILIMALLFSAITAIQLVKAAKANPLGLIPKELKPFLVSIRTPQEDGRVLHDQFTLTFIVGNPPLGGANGITCRIEGLPGVAISPESYVSSESGSFYTEYSNFTYSVTVNAAGLSDGWHSLAVVVSGTALYSPDQTGVSAVETEIGGSDSIRFLFDTVPPSISVLLPRNETYTTSDLPLNFTLSEQPSWVGYSLDGQSPTTIAGNTTLDGLPQGLHNVTVYANDTVGRKGNSETVYFNITQETEQEFTAQPETFPITPMAVASGVSAAVAAAGLLVYFRKRKRGQPT